MLRMPNSDLSVLVVDDDRDMVDSAVLLLGCAGFRAIAAYSAEMAAGIAIFRHPAVVLLDLAMPGMDGFSLARNLRRLPGMEGALLICISAYGTEQVRQQSFTAGCDYHMLKPVHWPELISVLRRLEICFSAESGHDPARVRTHLTRSLTSRPTRRDHV